MQRFFIPQSAGYQIDQRIVFPDEAAHQLRAVLRKAVGDQVWVLDNVGGLYEVVLTAVSRAQITGKILTKQPAGGEPQVKLTLFQSLTKRDKFEWVLQKGTELGVHCFVPVVTQRTLVQDVQIKPGKLQRWQKIVTEGAEQSRRGCVPVVASALQFAAAFPQAAAFDLSLIAWEGEQKVNLPTILGHKPAPQTVALFIGPEGGFTEEEVENGRYHGLIPFTLGDRILRTETAAIVASALILHELGELG